MNRFRPTLRHAALLAVALALPLAAAKGRGMAQERALPVNTGVILPPWHVVPIHIRYERGPSPILGNRVHVTARVTNNGALPVPLVGSGTVRFELEGTEFHKPVSIDSSRNGLLPRGSQVIMTAVFVMSAAEQRRIRYLHIGRADPNLYNTTGVTRIARFDVPPPLD